MGGERGKGEREGGGKEGERKESKEGGMEGGRERGMEEGRKGGREGGRNFSPEYRQNSNGSVTCFCHMAQSYFSCQLYSCHKGTSSEMTCDEKLLPGP